MRIPNRWRRWRADWPGFLRVQKDEGKEQGQGNCERHDHRSAQVNQKGHQNDQNQDHAEEQIVFDGVDGQLDQVAAVIVRAHFDVWRQHLLIQFLRFGFDAFEDVLRLLAAPHHDDAFDSVIGSIEAELAEAGGISNDHLADVADTHRHAICVPTMILPMSAVSRTRPMRARN